MNASSLRHLDPERAVGVERPRVLRREAGGKTERLVEVLVDLERPNGRALAGDGESVAVDLDEELGGGEVGDVDRDRPLALFIGDSRVMSCESGHVASFAAATAFVAVPDCPRPCYRSFGR